jgi:hypothetical protein
MVTRDACARVGEWQAGFDKMGEETRQHQEYLTLHTSVVRQLMEHSQLDDLHQVLDEMYTRELLLPVDVTGLVLQAAVAASRPELALLAVRLCVHPVPPLTSAHTPHAHSSSLNPARVDRRRRCRH